MRLYEELPVGLDGEKDVENVLEASKSKMSQIIADVTIETFPLRPVSERILDLDGNSSERPVLTGKNLKEKETENMELQAGNSNTVPSRMDFLENSSGLVDEKAHSSSAIPICSSTNKESTACSAGNKVSVFC